VWRQSVPGTLRRSDDHRYQAPGGFSVGRRRWCSGWLRSRYYVIVCAYVIVLAIYGSSRVRIESDGTVGVEIATVRHPTLLLGSSPTHGLLLLVETCHSVSKRGSSSSLARCGILNVFVSSWASACTVNRLIRADSIGHGPGPVRAHAASHSAINWHIDPIAPKTVRSQRGAFRGFKPFHPRKYRVKIRACLYRIEGSRSSNG